MRNHLRKVLDVARLQIHKVVRFEIVFNVPEVDSQVVRADKALGVWGSTHKVDVVVVAVSVLAFFNTIVAFVDQVGLGQLNLSIGTNGGFRVLLMVPVVELPEFNDAVVGRQHLQRSAGVVQELHVVDLLVQLNRLQVVELRLVRLHLVEVPVIKVARVLQINVFEHNNTSSSISYCKVISRLIECNGREHVGFGNIVLVALTKSVNINPVKAVADPLSINLGFARHLRLQVVRRLLYLRLGCSPIIYLVYFHHINPAELLYLI